MSRVQLVSILAAAGLLLIVLELVRRRRLLERYALLWMLAALVILGLAAWKEGLERLASSLGVISPPNALFFVALGFIVVLLLHFSAAVSRLSDQSKVLAQRLAIMEQRMRQLEADDVEEEPDRQLLAPTRAAGLAGTAGRERS